VAGSCENSNELSGPCKAGNFLTEWISASQEGLFFMHLVSYLAIQSYQINPRT
jgi:hypothetical protein